MRTILIEISEPGEPEIITEVSKCLGQYRLLLNLGLDAKELLTKGTHEFLTHSGVQYRISLLMPNTFISTWEGHA